MVGQLYMLVRTFLRCHNLLNICTYNMLKTIGISILTMAIQRPYIDFTNNSYIESSLRHKSYSIPLKQSIRLFQKFNK